ncbi:MAG: hypothetical protein WC712_06185 [Candidatus Brocadiia bacterium]
MLSDDRLYGLWYSLPFAGGLILSLLIDALVFTDILMLKCP